MKVLTKIQSEQFKQKIIPQGDPVRFMRGGSSVNITTGETTPKGCNVIDQIVYWCFARETSREIANLIGARAEFDKA